MQLLQLPMEQYGNFPLMRKAFLRACKTVHPDKGGSDQLSQELIGLYRRLETSLPSLSSQDFTETEKVCVVDNLFYLKDWIDCNNISCHCCLFCLLRDSHKSNKLPKVWGSCYCFQCYITWFGLEHSRFIFNSWQMIIAKTPFTALNI